MPDINLPLSSAPGMRQAEGGGRLINAYAERLGEGAMAPYARRRVPGLSTFATAPQGPCRGFIFVSGVLLACMGERLVSIAVDGAVTDLGALAGTQKVIFSRNNKVPTPDILAVTELGVFVITTSGAPTPYSDPDLPQPTSVTFIDGYFMFPIGDGRVFASGLNTTTVNALDFARAEARPGGLIRAVSFGQQLFLCGPNVIEVWSNTGNATGFPFSRAAVIPRGLASTFAIAGFEDGFTSTLLWVGDDNKVYRTEGGYTPVPTSTHDVERSIEAVANKGLLEALVLVSGGHAQWAISGPGFTWVYDLTTGQWHERKSFESERWRARCSVLAYGEWMVGDVATGAAYAVNDRAHREGDDPLVWEVISAQGAGFPNRLAIPRADFNFVVGQGVASGEDPIEVAPRAEIAWSDNGGTTWSDPLVRELGAQGAYGNRVSINRCGLTGPMGRQWRVRVSDPVFVSLISASHEVEVRPR